MMIGIGDSEFNLALSLYVVHQPLQIVKFYLKFLNNWIRVYGKYLVKFFYKNVTYLLIQP